MRTTFVLPLLLLTGLVLTGCGSKVAVINSTRIYQESEAGKAGLAYLEQVEQEVRVKAEAAQKIAESMPDNDALPLSLQKFFVSCQEAMNGAQQQAVTSVQELITKAINEYRAQNKITVIMQNDAVVSADPNADVTAGVVAEMNKTSISFTPIKIDDFVAPPAQAKPAKAAKKAPRAQAPKTAAPAAPATAPTVPAAK